MNNFLAQLEERLKAKELTQQRIADVAGVSQPTVQRWLSRETQPKLSEAEAVCDAFAMLWTLEAVKGMDLPEGGVNQKSDLEIWRDRAKRAEKEAADLKAGMRKLLGISLEPPSAEEVLATGEGERIDRAHRKR